MRNENSESIALRLTWNELSERGEELFSALDMGELLMNWGTKPPCEFIFNWSSGC